jgi:ferrochelatase
VVQELLKQTLTTSSKPVRVLFSAHGLPQRVIDQGDPYAFQVSQSVKHVVALFPDLDHRVCYQSKVGKLKWLEPSLEEEIKRAAQDQVGVIIVPISFVSEHSETLVELDVDFANLAQRLGLPFYARTPTVSCQLPFIRGLASQVICHVFSYQNPIRVCPESYQKCWCRRHG